MAATAAKQRTNWRQVIDLLTGKAEKNLESYGDMVNPRSSNRPYLQAGEPWWEVPNVRKARIGPGCSW